MFAARIVNVVTGLIFQIMIARSLLPKYEHEYDLWFNINDIIAYFALMAAVLPFWAMRFVARDKEGAAKTGIFANLAISAIATLIYILIIPWVTSALGISEEYLPIYLLIALYVVEFYSISALEACLQARIPHTVGYGLIVQQVGKVILGYIFIIVFQQRLLGIVIATLAAIAVQTAYYFGLLAQELKQKVKWEYVKEWLKGSVASIYGVVGGQVAALIFFMLFIYGGEGARGRLGAASIIVNVITFSSVLAFALYPKLMAERKSEDITTSLKMVLMLAIPLTVGAMVLSDSYITIFTDVYRDAALVLVVLAIDAFVGTVSTIFGTVVVGVETFDEEAKISLRQLAKSRLFKYISLPYFHSLISLPTAFFVLTNYALNQPLQAALYVGIINLLAKFAMFLVVYAMVRKIIRIDIPWKAIAKYVFAAAVMGAILYVVPHPTRISTTLATTVFGGIIYLAIIMVIDKQARTLPKNIWQEIKQRRIGNP